MEDEVFYISVVIPVYNSSKQLLNLHQRLINTLTDISNNYEIIFVDDCSPNPNSWNTIKKISKIDKNIKAFRLSKNYSQHNATLCGIRKASGNIIVTMDDDLQNPPEEIPNLINELKKGFDVVYGNPIKDKRYLMRKLITKLTKKALSLATGKYKAKKISSFRIFKTFLRNSFENFNSEIINIDILLSYSTQNMSEIKVNHNIREYGNSGYNLRKLINLTLNILTGFSTAPLHFATLLGITMSIFGVGIFTYVVLNWLFYETVVRGFTFLASIIAIFSGSQLLAIGILGEYIARIHTKLLGRPSYIISEKINEE